MLVLSRKRSERLLIGNRITITIVKIGPDAVRLGIDAPREMKVVREELVARDTEAAPVLMAQHEGPLEADGGPCGSPVLAGTERVAPDLKVLGITPQECKP